MGLLCQASPKPKDTIYTNVEALLKEVRTTKKKTATYYVVLKHGDDKGVKVRIDLKQIDADIPVYKSDKLDIKKLLALKEESLEAPMKKFAESKVKLDLWISVNNEVKTLKTQIKSLKTGDSLNWDNKSIDSIQGILNQKNIIKNEKYKAYEATFSEYEKMISNMLGDLKGQYKNRLSAAIEEAYHKLENTETVFFTAQDAPTWHDVRINLIKLDARRSMKVNYIAREAKKVTESITAGKFYYIMHFAEFGLFFPTKVQGIIDVIKEKEMKLNPYLTGERFALVCDDQDRTQDHINNVVNPWDYDKIETKAQPEFPITTDQLKEIFPDTDEDRITEVVDLINEYSNDYGLTTKTRMAHFLAQIGTETDGLEVLKERSNYSAKNIYTTFLYVKRTKEEGTTKTHKYCDLIENYDCSDLSSCPNEYNGPNRCSTELDYYYPADYKKWTEDGNSVKTTYVNSSSLFDYVYSCRMDNGAKSTKDGSTYLGKGFIHLTGKDKYKRVSEAWNEKYPNDIKEFHGDDIEELENDVEVAMKASLILWEEDDLNSLADKGLEQDEIDKVGAKINGSGSGLPNGYKQRRNYTNKANEVFSED
nr:hypothetical protein [uncultured Allomuricauda sp.]